MTKAILKRLILFSILFFIIIYICEYLKLDFFVQDFFFTHESQWSLQDPSGNLRKIFYHAPRMIVFCIAILILILAVCSYRKNQKRRFIKYLFVFLSMLTIILVSVSLKDLTNMQCPYHLKHYGGSNDYLKLFQLKSDYSSLPGFVYSREKCFPAGHASGGLALISLFYFLENRRFKVISLIFALFLGGVMGLYQMLRGAHFLSHNLVTLLISIFISEFFYFIYKQIKHSKI